ncbi:hypothetical protein Tco_1417029 [Tanacetum coccineum]
MSKRTKEPDQNQEPDRNQEETVLEFEIFQFLVRFSVLIFLKNSVLESIGSGSGTSYDYFPGQTTSDEISDHNPFQATFNESYDHNPFQVTSDDTSNDTLKSSAEDTCKQGSRSAKAKKTTISSEIAQWYDDFSSDEVRTVYKGRRGSSFRNAAITK